MYIWKQNKTTLRKLTSCKKNNVCSASDYISCGTSKLCIWAVFHYMNSLLQPTHVFTKMAERWMLCSIRGTEVGKSEKCTLDWSKFKGESVCVLQTKLEMLLIDYALNSWVDKSTPLGFPSDDRQHRTGTSDADTSDSALERSRVRPGASEGDTDRTVGPLRLADTDTFLWVFEKAVFDFQSWCQPFEIYLPDTLSQSSLTDPMRLHLQAVNKVIFFCKL